MNAVLFRREMKRSLPLLGIFAAVLAVYIGTIVAMFDPSLGASLDEMAQSMPQLFAAFGMLNAGATLVEFLTNYLYGFLMIALPLVFIILEANRLVAQYVDRGSMACLLAAPVSRGRIVRTQAAVLLLDTLLLAAFSCGLAVGFSAALFPYQLETPTFLVVNAGLLGVLVLFDGVCFFSSCAFSDGRLAVGAGAGVCVLFVLVQMLRQVGDSFAWLRWCTPLSLFDTQGILYFDSLACVKFAVLYAAGLALMAAACAVFCKKDLAV